MTGKKFSCDEIDEFVTDYVEGTLEPCNVEHCESHFEQCKACRDNLMIIKGIVSTLGEIPEDDVPLEFAENVADIAFAQKAPEKSLVDYFRGLLQPAMVALPVAAVVLLGLFFAVSPSDNSSRVASHQSSDFDELRLVKGATASGGILHIDGMKVDVRTSAVAVSGGQKIRLSRESSSANLSLADGSVVALSHRAHVSLEEDRILLEQGRLDLTMAPTGVGFTVTTPHADVVVRGTVYSVEVGAATRVRVESGSVAVESRLSHEVVLLKAGDKISVLESGKVRKLIESDSMTGYTPPSVTPSGQAENTDLGIDDSN
jgi:hypothetical protein